jgi:hypothetical protein
MVDEQDENEGKGMKDKEENEKNEIHSPLHDLSTLAHRILSPHSTLEEYCHQILIPLDDHDTGHKHSGPPINEKHWKENR